MIPQSPLIIFLTIDEDEEEIEEKEGEKKEEGVEEGENEHPLPHHPTVVRPRI